MYLVNGQKSVLKKSHQEVWHWNASYDLFSVSIRFFPTVNYSEGLSDYKRCSMTCVIIIIVILALGFIVLFAVLIRKCNERTLALRTRIQSFVVSEPGSVSLEHATEQELEQMDEDGEAILINVKDTNERNSQEPENETKNQRETKEESLTPEVERTSVELNDKGTKD